VVVVVFPAGVAAPRHEALAQRQRAAVGKGPRQQPRPGGQGEAEAVRHAGGVDPRQFAAQGGQGVGVVVQARRQALQLLAQRLRVVVQALGQPQLTHPAPPPGLTLEGTQAAVVGSDGGGGSTATIAPPTTTTATFFDHLPQLRHFLCVRRVRGLELPLQFPHFRGRFAAVFLKLAQRLERQRVLRVTHVHAPRHGFEAFHVGPQQLERGGGVRGPGAGEGHHGRLVGLVADRVHVQRHVLHLARGSGRHGHGLLGRRQPRRVLQFFQGVVDGGQGHFLGRWLRWRGLGRGDNSGGGGRKCHRNVAAGGGSVVLDVVVDHDGQTDATEGNGNRRRRWKSNRWDFDKTGSSTLSRAITK